MYILYAQFVIECHMLCCIDASDAGS